MSKLQFTDYNAIELVALIAETRIFLTKQNKNSSKHQSYYKFGREYHKLVKKNDW